jgi:hypothetical protein
VRTACITICSTALDIPWYIQKRNEVDSLITQPCIDD